MVFRTLNSQGQFATAKKVSLAAYNRYLLTENLTSSTIDAEQVSQEHTCDLHTTSRNTDHPQALPALADSTKTSQTHCGHQGFQQLTRGMQNDDSLRIPEPVMYGIYRPVATSVSNTCMCS